MAPRQEVCASYECIRRIPSRRRRLLAAEGGGGKGGCGEGGGDEGDKTGESGGEGCDYTSKIRQELLEKALDAAPA